VNRSLLESVLRRVAPLAEGNASDAELLRRFAADGDETAFAAIVRRHGPLVWAVARGLLLHEADAEDAFQATFLALVRSARSVRAPARLAPWLHGVACRVALKARRSAVRRKQRERTAAAKESAPTVAQAEWDRLRATLHEEVCRLAEPLRAAFVLCEL
jgi:RNA polymerase sigma factor (sigma-70 family)